MHMNSATKVMQYIASWQRHFDLSRAPVSLSSQTYYLDDVDNVCYDKKIMINKTGFLIGRDLWLQYHYSVITANVPLFRNSNPVISVSVENTALNLDCASPSGQTPLALLHITRDIRKLLPDLLSFSFVFLRTWGRLRGRLLRLEIH